MMKKKNHEFSELLAMATAFHGHLCSGQIIGVRMAMLGLSELGMADPRGKDSKKLMLFMEVSRCAADAIMTVTGCRVGKRSFKLMDTGKVAATFIRMDTFSGVRVIAASDAEEKILARHPEREESEALKMGYREMSDRDLFTVQEVSVNVNHEDTPGTPVRKIRCALCGETVLDNRDIEQNGTILCRPCAIGSTYYTAQSTKREPIQEGIFL